MHDHNLCVVVGDNTVQDHNGIAGVGDRGVQDHHVFEVTGTGESRMSMCL